MTEEEAEGYRKHIQAHIRQSKAALAAPAGSAATPQYAVRWLLGSGKAVQVGDLKMVMDVAKRWLEMGAYKIEIHTVAEMQQNEKLSHRRPE